VNKFKKGDIVGRKSYGKDIIFSIEKIINIDNKQFAILKGITIRVKADSPLNDLVLVEKNRINNHIRSLDIKLEKRINEINKLSKSTSSKFKRVALKDNLLRERVYTGKILHLDGDKKYTEKSYRYYKSLGLNAIVKNIPENKQSFMVQSLLDRYNPDILVITGHDGMIKSGTGYNDIYNYRNSRHFMDTVKKSRQWDVNKKLVIFAGACQSYFEALISAGANFASSPARILIDFADPLIVAEKVATTENYKYLTINDFSNELRDGIKGVGGTGAKGKKEIILL